MGALPSGPGQAPEGPAAPRLPRAWLLFAVPVALCVGVMLVSLASPAAEAAGEATSLVAQWLASIALAALAFAAARRQAGRARLAWALVAVGPGATVLLLVAYLAMVALGGPPFPDLALAAFVGVFALTSLAGLVLLSPPQVRGGTAVRFAVDALIAGVSLFFILWAAFDYEQLAGGVLLEDVLGLLYPAVGIASATVALLVLGLARGAVPAWYRLVAASAFLVLATDLAASFLDVAGVATGAAVIADSGAATSALLLALAAARAAPWPDAAREEHYAAQWSPYLPFGLALLTALYEYGESGGLSPPLFGIAMAGVALVLARTLLLLGQNRQLAESLRGESAFKTRLLRFISHEMANPLSPLRIELSLLRRAPADGAGRSWAVVDRSIERLLSLSHDVREMALAETQRLLSHVEVADIGAQVAAACQSAAPVAQQRGLELTLHAALEPLPARVDRQRFGQVLDNLLSNSIKFTPSPGRITVRVLRDGEHVRVQVSDTGIGLAPADVEGLFQPFRRVQDAMAPGLGLGLYLCRAILVELHGTIGVSSAGRGQGATFWVKVPLDGTPESAKLPLGPARGPAAAPPAEPPTPTAVVRFSPSPEAPPAPDPGSGPRP